MFCVTFYSYKGGVGRTLALANVAAALAQRDKKVLIVDFDLEAPGLTTLHMCADARRQPGIVEFVNEYLDQDKSPDASGFVHQCAFLGPDEKNLTVWVMPAGDLDDNYRLKYDSINWRNLYEQRQGFLLFEDLRSQWERMGFDYVLVDSRTGLTDISGICTRQLPDAVVAVFFPNEQNLIGLQEVIGDVRSEHSRKQGPELIFVPSRVPRLDDEDGLLKSLLARFESSLRYQRYQVRVIEHYDSMALLDQRLFVLERPRSGLAKQYRSLAALISQLNVDDADGARSYVRRVRDIYRQGGEKFDLENDIQSLHVQLSDPFSFLRIIERIDEIRDRHAGDYVVQSELAEHFFAGRDFSRLEVSVKRGLESLGVTGVAEPSPTAASRLRYFQMRLHSELGNSDLAQEGAHGVLADANSTESMVLDSLAYLLRLRHAAVPAPADLPFFRSLEGKEFGPLLQKLETGVLNAHYVAQIAKLAADRLDRAASTTDGVIPLVTAMIAGGEFKEAIDLIDRTERSEPFDRVAFQFNRAMAAWGAERDFPREDFEALYGALKEALSSFGDGANYQQCLGLVCAVLGHRNEAVRAVASAMAIVEADSASARTFSCWSYLSEQSVTFLQHCDAIRRYASGDATLPLVLARNWKRSPGHRGSAKRQNQ